MEVVAGEDEAIDRSMEDLRSAAFAIAGDAKRNAVSVLFCLDNQETLEEDELEEIGEFLTNLPIRCKAIVTTRGRLFPGD